MKVIFIGCIGMTPKELLNQFKKLTPNNSGVYKNIEGTDDITQASIVVVLEGLPTQFDNYMLKNKKVICFPLEPPIIRPSKDFPLKSDKMYLEKHHYVTHFLGFLNPKITYDELKNLPYNPKPKNVCIISSNIKLTQSHIQRVEFIKKLVVDIPNCDLFGYGWDEEAIPKKNYKGPFGNGYRGNKIQSKYKHKMDILNEYNYVIVIENCQYKNYFTEKITDVILGWSYPIYFGASNIKNILPSNSVTCININNYDQSLKTIKTLILNKPTDNMIKGLEESRHKILDQFNIWASLNKLVE